MALKPCRECGREVAKGASKCPHCGIHNPAGGLDTTLRGNCLSCLALPLLFLLAVVAIGMCGTLGG